MRNTVPQVADQVELLVQEILRTGEPITGIEANGQRTDGSNAERVWITYWHPLKAEDGAILGINVAAEEITEQKRAKAALQLANESLEARTLELTSSLEELRDAQDRLVQTKKLASLGQLTAGIAHEIKNPLNFVNNFSSVSIELAVELQEAIKFQEFNDEKRTEIHDVLDMLQGNLGKIVQHGRREFYREEHASAFAPDLRRAPLCRSQRTRGGKPRSRLSRGTGREGRLQYHPGAFL